MSPAAYSTKRLDHLGLVAGFCQEINLASVIDKALGISELRQVSYGQLFTAMLLNGLGFTRRTLHMYSEFFDDKPVSRLIGEGVEASHINDDALGRCLDALYDTGVSGLYQQIAAKVIDHLKLPCEFTHLDSTSFHYDGKANSGEEAPAAIHITRGYSRDHRPELNQVVLNLICENLSGIPVYMQAQSGNTAQLYVNGVLEHSHNAAGTTFNDSSSVMLIGAAVDRNGVDAHAGDMFNGLLDVNTVFQRALSTSEVAIQADPNSTIPPVSYLVSKNRDVQSLSHCFIDQNQAYGTLGSIRAGTGYYEVEGVNTVFMCTLNINTAKRLQAIVIELEPQGSLLHNWYIEEACQLAVSWGDDDKTMTYAMTAGNYSANPLGEWDYLTASPTLNDNDNAQINRAWLECTTKQGNSRLNVKSLFVEYELSTE